VTGGRRLRWLAAYALPPAAWAGVIFWLSSRTAAEANDYLGPAAGVPLLSEAIHIGEYFILSFLLFRLGAAVGATTPAPARVRPRESRDLVVANVAGLAAFLYAVSDEVHQSFVPGRTSSVVDLAVDLAGAVTGVAAAWALIYHRRGCRNAARTGTRSTLG
jgi:VanZ family protein